MHVRQPTHTPLTWRIEQRSGATLVVFSGEIDENADFGDLEERLTGNVIFHLGGIRRINSCGVREWVSFVRVLSRRGGQAQAQGVSLVFIACSPVIVTQLNTIYNFRGGAKIVSFLAPYLCDRCSHEEEILLEVATHFAGRARRPPEFACPACGGEMELDDLPERYLSFLNDS
jgi:hypothetical protein